MVTHPYHPLSGRRLAVLFTERKAGSLVFVCEDSGEEWVRLPLVWTDRGPEAASHRLAAEGLVALHALVSALAGAPTRRCTTKGAGDSLETEDASLPAPSEGARRGGAGREPDGDGDGAGQHGARGAGGEGRS
ncbi:DUF5372 family protein [Streptomyces sp. NPDC057909]|uniref:DUF5372 family protein n=1 Tax=Streptomyces sp. NPDC057909 TaxID=3346277 RepID=UPI0036E47138